MTAKTSTFQINGTCRCCFYNQHNLDIEDCRRTLHYREEKAKLAVERICFRCTRRTHNARVSKASTTTSKAFTTFATHFDFQHAISSPRFLRVNGLAEKRDRIVKRILKKTAHAGETFWLGLLNYRCTSLDNGKSPYEMFTGRRLRTRLPDFSVEQGKEVKKRRQKSRAGR